MMWNDDDVLVEELAKDATLCLLVRHARATGGVGIGASLLLLEACKGGHKARALV